MPLYSFTCPNCKWSGDRIVSIADRDKQVCHDPFNHTTPCQTHLERIEIPDSQTNFVDKRWGYKAIMGDGQRVPGSFGMGRPRNHKGFG